MITSLYSVKKVFKKILPVALKEMILAKIVELRPIFSFDTRGYVQLKHFFVLNVPTSQHVRKLILTFTIQQNIAHPNQNDFTSVNFVIKFLLAYILGN